MSPFPHTVTLYNTEKSRDSREPGTDRIINHITVLQGVLLEEGRSVRAGGTGTARTDRARLFVPFSVKARDGETGQEKQYAAPEVFRAMADKAGYWTLEPGDNCFLVKGEVIEPEGSLEKLSGAFKAASVKTRNFGSARLWHFEVQG